MANFYCKGNQNMIIQLWGKRLFFIQLLIAGSVFLAGCGKTPEEEYALGERYYKGGGGEGRNLAEAVKWYRKAAERGHAGAQFALGMFYCKGEGVEKNHAEAVKWWRKAAEQGQADAQFNLGLCCYTGDDVEKNHAEAVKWWRKAAAHGQADAQFNLGLCCYNGDGVGKNHAEAVKWWLEAAAQDNVNAQANLAECFYNGDGIEKDHAKAVNWWRVAAENGHNDAKVKLGACYHNGDGVERDIAEAVKWWRNAASNPSQGKAASEMAAKLLRKPWEDLRAKGEFGVRFGTTFNPEKKESISFTLGWCEFFSCFKNDNFLRKKGDWADAVGVSITPKSHRVFRIIGAVKVKNKKERDNLRSFLEERFYMTMKENDFGIKDNTIRNTIKEQGEIYDYQFSNEEFSIRISFHKMTDDSFFNSYENKPMYVVFTDRKLEEQAKLEAGGKGEFDIWFSHNWRLE